MLGISTRQWGISMGLALAAFSAPAWATPSVPRPGSLNYVEGQASIDDETVTSKAVGSAELNAGDVLSTGNGHAEMLLTPGVYLRLGKNSAVRMIAPELTNTQVAVLRGEAMVEVDQIHQENAIRVENSGSSTELLKNGVYDFMTEPAPEIRVLDGKARVYEGDQHVDLGKGHEAFVGNAPLKSEKFDRKDAERAEDLYQWSKLRSEYLAEATAATAQTYVVDGGGWWYGPGWYWNPWWGMYSFVPGGGFFYNPFGWGLYSPYYVVRTPIYAYPGRWSGGRAVVPSGPSRAITRPQGRWHSSAIGPSPAMRAPIMRSAPAMGGMGGFRGGLGRGRR